MDSQTRRGRAIKSNTATNGPSKGRKSNGVTPSERACNERVHSVVQQPVMPNGMPTKEVGLKRVRTNLRVNLDGQMV